MNHRIFNSNTTLNSFLSNVLSFSQGFPQCYSTHIPHRQPLKSCLRHSPWEFLHTALLYIHTLEATGTKNQLELYCLLHLFFLSTGYANLMTSHIPVSQQARTTKTTTDNDNNTLLSFEKDKDNNTVMFNQYWSDLHSDFFCRKPC